MLMEQDAPRLRKLVGLSLSKCIDDILDGKVLEQEVIGIASGTTAKNLNEIEWVCQHYSERWSDGGKYKARGEQGIAIAMRLFQAGKVYQPRLEGHSISRRNGWWRDFLGRSINV